MINYYDKEGKPLAGTLEWGTLFEDMEYRRIAKTTLQNGTWVSTVWMGFNHRRGDGPPLIFETMVFASKGIAGDDMDTDRYSTLAEALDGHERMVEKWRLNNG